MFTVGGVRRFSFSPLLALFVSGKYRLILSTFSPLEVFTFRLQGEFPVLAPGLSCLYKITVATAEGTPSVSLCDHLSELVAHTFSAGCREFVGTVSFVLSNSPVRHRTLLVAISVPQPPTACLFHACPLAVCLSFWLTWA